LLWLGIPILYWVRVGGVNIFILFLTLEKIISVFSPV
jgi:hypothetical protein